MPIKKMHNGTYKVDVSLGSDQLSNKRKSVDNPTKGNS